MSEVQKCRLQSDRVYVWCCLMPSMLRTRYRVPLLFLCNKYSPLYCWEGSAKRKPKSYFRNWTTMIFRFLTKRLSCHGNVETKGDVNFEAPSHAQSIMSVLLPSRKHNELTATGCAVAKLQNRHILIWDISHEDLQTHAIGLRNSDRISPLCSA